MRSIASGRAVSPKIVLARADALRPNTSRAGCAQLGETGAGRRASVSRAPLQDLQRPVRARRRRGGGPVEARRVELGLRRATRSARRSGRASRAAHAPRQAPSVRPWRGSRLSRSLRSKVLRPATSPREGVRHVFAAPSNLGSLRPTPRTRSRHARSAHSLASSPLGSPFRQSARDRVSQAGRAGRVHTSSTFSPQPVASSSKSTGPITIEGSALMFAAMRGSTRWGFACCISRPSSSCELCRWLLSALGGSLGCTA